MHAYLIMAHNNFGILEKLIHMLDHACNDIYVHIDKSVKSFDFDYFEKIPKKAGIYFTERKYVSWGGFSMVNVEYILLKEANKNQNRYSYYHLISGVDLPLKNAAELAEFFDGAYPKEFVHFATGLNSVEMSRIKHFHFFTGRRNLLNRAATKAEEKIQTLIGINRVKDIKVARGSQWFSITDRFARYLLDNEQNIKKRLRFTFIPDEFFVQLAVVNSPFENSLYSDKFDDGNEQNMRFIDWKRGNPYTFNEADFDEIMSSGCLFVRKLTEENKLPDMIFDRVCE